MRKNFSVFKSFVILLCAFCLPNQSFGIGADAHVFHTDLGFPGIDLNGVNCPQSGKISPSLRDYTDPFWHTKPITAGNNYLHHVETFHFTPKVESLTGGTSSGTIYGDLLYTLSKFPNHYRALYSISLYYAWKVYIRDNRAKLIDDGERMIPAECFFNRAIAFKKQDPKLYYLYGVYLYKVGELDLALEQFKKSEKLNPKDIYLISNMAKLYYDKGDYNNAVAYIKKAPKQTKAIKKLVQMLADKKVSIDSN